jgi:drug/metabolite transporter (DMT)-like permease
MTTPELPKQGAHVDIPAVSSISGGVAMHADRGRTLWSSFGPIVVFGLALTLVALPLVLLFLLLRQPDTETSGLAWLWIAMMVITGAISFLVAYGIVRSVLEADAR